MEYRYYTKDDYLMVLQWWTDWNWSPIPEICLPKTGIVVSNGGVDLAASFIYSTDSCICWAENFITNKHAPKDLRKGATDFLIERTVEEAKNQGFVVVMSSVKQEGLIKKLIAAGYDKDNAETGMTNLTRIL